MEKKFNILRKISIGVILLLFSFSIYKSVDASTVSLYNCYKQTGRQWTSVSERAVEAAKYGIWGYRGSAEQNIALAGYMCPEIDEGRLGYSVVTDYQKTLRSSMNSTQATIPVSSLELKDGTILDMTMLGDKVFLTLEPGRNKEEIVMCTGITASPATFTGCSRGLAFSGTSTAEVAANKNSHGAGSVVVMSNVHYTFEELTDKDTDETVNGVWTFTSTSPMIFNVTPYVSSSADTYIGDDYLATQKYVNDVGAGGFTISNVSSSFGLETYGTSPETVGINASSSLGMSFDDDGALYQKTSSTIGSDVNGLYVNMAEDYTWTGEHTFGNTTTINGDLTVTATSTLATTTINGNNLNELLDGGTTTLHTHEITTITGTLVVGDNLIKSADTERSTSSVAYVKLKEISVPIAGTYRVKFDMKESGGGTAYGRIYKNGVAFGTEQSDNTGTYANKAEDLVFAAGDLIQLYAKRGNGTVEVRNFRLYVGFYDIGTVNLD